MNDEATAESGGHSMTADLTTRTVAGAISAAERMAELNRAKIKLQGHTAQQVVRMTGVSYRQLYYWDDTGLLVPSVQRRDGSGSVCLYSDEDVERVRIIAGLLEAGFQLSALRDYSWGQRTDLLNAVRAVREGAA